MTPCCHQSSPKAAALDRRRNGARRLGALRTCRTAYGTGWPIYSAAMTSQPGAGRRPDRVRLGIVGLGAVAQAVHLPLIERLGLAFSISAIADLSPSLTTAIGERYRVAPERRADSVDALLGMPELDALVILTSGSHGPAVEAGVDAGLPVFAEKPLAFTLAEADAIEGRLAADPGRRLQVGYMKLYDPAVLHARALAEERGYGSPRAIEVTVLHPTSEAQLAHARLLPPPSDVADATRATLTEATERLRRDALGEPADGPSDASTPTSSWAASCTSWPWSGCSLATRPPSMTS